MRRDECESGDTDRVKTTIELERGLRDLVKHRCVDLSVTFRTAIEDGLKLWLKDVAQ